MKEYIEKSEAVERALYTPIMSNGPVEEKDIDAWSDGAADAQDQIAKSIGKIPAAKVIEAPCDIGDVFWRVDHIRKRVERVKVSGLTKKANGTWKIRITCHFGVYEIVPSEIGKHVFRTEEEAEVAFNERVH